MTVSRYSALDAAMLAVGGWRCERCIGEVKTIFYIIETKDYLIKIIITKKYK